MYSVQREEQLRHREPLDASPSCKKPLRPHPTCLAPPPVRHGSPLSRFLASASAAAISQQVVVPAAVLFPHLKSHADLLATLCGWDERSYDDSEDGDDRWMVKCRGASLRSPRGGRCRVRSVQLFTCFY